MFVLTVLIVAYVTMVSADMLPPGVHIKERPTHRPSKTVEPCYCVYYLSCINGTIDNTGSLVLNERLNLRKTTSARPPLEPRYLDRTCPVGEKCCYLGKPTVTEPATTIQSSTTEETSQWLSGCGWMNPYGLNQRSNAPKLLGKFDVYEGQYPWQVALLRVDSDITGNLVFKCGATLISNRYVMTAAHCVYNKLTNSQTPAKELRVRLGVTNIKANDEDYPFREFDIRRIIVHPQYNPTSLRNDVALLLLDGVVPFSKHISPVCLPETDAVDADFVDHRCVALGWGKDSFINGQFQSNLQAVQLPVLDHYKCQTLLKNTSLTAVFNLHESFICAGGQEGFDTCTGDGGGPLACLNADERYVQIGITSWGVQCGQKNVPGVYADLTVANNWIRRTMSKF